jgi:broad specificity phosphatase PhoE
MNDDNPIRLILVRHGNTFEPGQTATQVGARTDLSLTDQGRNQAQYFAHYLASEQIYPHAIYAGALKRQIETAQILGSHLQVGNKIQLHEPALTEIDYGPWEGLTSHEITQQWPNEYKAWTAQSQWPEIFGSTQECHLSDIKKWLNELRSVHVAGETVIGVTSNGVIRFFYSFQDKEWQNLIHTHRMEDLKVKTGHFCELLLFKDSLQIKNWNKNPRDFI